MSGVHSVQGSLFALGLQQKMMCMPEVVPPCWECLPPFPDASVDVDVLCDLCAKPLQPPVFPALTLPLDHYLQCSNFCALKNTLMYTVVHCPSMFTVQKCSQPKVLLATDFAFCLLQCFLFAIYLCAAFFPPCPPWFPALLHLSAGVPCRKKAQGSLMQLSLSATTTLFF